MNPKGQSIRTPPPATGTPARTALLLAAAGVALVALNLRAPITAVSPLLDQIRDQEGLGATVAGLLVTVPLICFFTLSTTALRIGRSLGTQRAIALSLAVLFLGSAIRLLPSLWSLLLGTVVIGFAITFGNVLLPVAIKRDHPARTGLFMGLYTMFLYVGAALAAGVTLPLQHATGFGWRGTLGLWAVLPIIGLIAWSAQSHGRRAPPEEAAAAARTPHTLWRQWPAWSVAISFAVPTLVFYTLSAWLPTVLTDAGMSSERAGGMLSAANLAAIPFALLMPIAATRSRRQIWCLTVGAALLIAGLAGLLAAPTTLAPLWMLLLGAGLGTGTGLGYTIPLLRSRDAQTTAKLSAVSQTVGFLLSALGPVAAGALHDLTDQWTITLLALAALVGLQAVAGLTAGRDRYVTDNPP